VPHPDRDADSEPYNMQAVWDTYLTTDIRPAIRAARRATMRRVLTTVTRQLCQLLNTRPSGIAARSPDPRQPYDICQIGAAMPAGLQLYHHLTQATAAHYLRAALLDPAEAATSRAYLATITAHLSASSTQDLRGILLHLADSLYATATEATATAAMATATAAGPDLDEDLRGLGASAALGIALYRDAVCSLTVLVLYLIWEGLGVTTPDYIAPGYAAICAN
jgi:hypothetical protein